MQRIAIFVDAGYLMARGADAVTGTQRAGRRAVILDEAKAVESLIQFAETKSKCKDGLLRVYWYDGAAQQPSAEQIRLAELDNVKLRLGTINSVGQQKGVDSLIIADMIELARNGAAADMLLVGGDEDLRIGVQIAQSYGARVHLLGIDIGGSFAQSPGLAREADTNAGWTVAQVSVFLAPRPPAVVPAVPAVAATPAPAPAPPPAPVAAVPAHATPAAHASPAQPLNTAVKVYQSTLLQSDVDDIKTVWDAGGGITQPYDGRLLASTGKALGRQLSIEERRDMRRAFIQLLEDSKWIV
jgi:uncharacterized LabA/DUF88 family protein